MGVPGQGAGEWGRGGGAERGLLTVFKAVALKITQASLVELLGHHAAPQDLSATGDHEAADEGEQGRCLHLLQARRPGEWAESRMTSTKVPGTLAPLKEMTGTVGVGCTAQHAQKNGRPAQLNHDLLILCGRGLPTRIAGTLSSFYALLF